MGDSAAWFRFTGLRLDELPEASYRTGSIWGAEDGDEVASGDILTIDGKEFVVVSAPMGEEPNYLVPKNNRSFTFFAYSRWDGHGGGGYEFDVFHDPFRPEEQEQANLHDAELLKPLQEKWGGTILVNEGWFDSITDGEEEKPPLHTIRGGIELDWKVISNEAQTPAVDEAWVEIWTPEEKELEERPFCLPRRAIPRLDPNAPWVCVYCHQPAIGGFGPYDRCCESCRNQVAAFRTEPWINSPN